MIDAHIIDTIGIGSITLLCKRDCSDPAVYGHTLCYSQVVGEHEHSATWSEVTEQLTGVTTLRKNNNGNFLQVCHRHGVVCKHFCEYGVLVQQTLANFLLLNHVRRGTERCQRGLGQLPRHALCHSSHCLKRFNRVLPVGRLTTQHHAVRAFSDSNGDISHFCTCWARVVNHGLKHVGCNNHRLALLRALGHNLGLDQRDLHFRQLSAEVATRHHCTVRCSDDLIKVLDSVDRFNLGQHKRLIVSMIAEKLLNCLNCLSVVHKRKSIEVHAVFYSKLEIRPIFVGDGR
mmetsp:Transcript_16034/g.30804  ORF Transcript_16034/g.30804 Transcript_16034/m.30804 type:complete len:288 (+) Transcript_16034:615-1478(+)